MVRSIRMLLAFTTLVGVLLAACSAPAQTTQPTAAPQPTPAEAAPVRIGSKNFTEAILVAEMYALALENAGIRVERKFNLGATPVAHTALVNGEIDLTRSIRRPVCSKC